MSAFYAGVDLGGTKITAGLGTADGKVVSQRTITTPAEAGPDAVLGAIESLVRELVDPAETADSIAALGVGVPGLVDVTRGITRFLPNLPTQWRDVPVADRLSNSLGCPVRVLNDVRTATLGELRFGHGRAVGTMAFFSLGTGVGGGVVIDGKLRLGPLGAAGELGHQTIVPDGPLCGCGNRGCLETLASGPAITAAGVRLLRSGMAPRLHAIVAGDTNRVSPQTMSEAAAAGDQAVHDAILRAATYLGIGVANVVTILHPELIVLGGGVAEIGEILIEQVRQIVRERVGMFPTNDIRIEKSAVGAGAGLLGAIALAAHGLESSTTSPT